MIKVLIAALALSSLSIHEVVIDPVTPTPSEVVRQSH